MQGPVGIPNPTRYQLFQFWTPHKLQEAIRAEQAILVIFGLFDVHMRLLFSRYGSEKLLA